MAAASNYECKVHLIQIDVHMSFVTGMAAPIALGPGCHLREAILECSSSWCLSSLNRESNCAPSRGRPNESRIGYVSHSACHDFDREHSCQPWVSNSGQNPNRLQLHDSHIIIFAKCA